MTDALTIFDDIKRNDEDLGEFRSARNLQKILEYSNWQRFESVIAKAI